MQLNRILFVLVLLLALGLAACAPIRAAASGNAARQAAGEAGGAGIDSTPVGVIATGFNSGAIIVREGLEAVLIIAVILSYMKTTRRDPKYSRLIFVGVGAAILLSLATWWIAESVIAVTEPNRELLEAITSLVAVGVLFYCTNWLFHKAYVVDWMSFIKQEAGKALATGSVLGLAALGFTVVYREGFETVLFYQAMLFNADPTPVLLGFVAGAAILIGLAFAVLKLSVRLPIRPFFSVTGALMLVLAFKFTGTGIHALQEAGLIPQTAPGFLPASSVLQQVLGFYPYLQPFLAQVGLLVAIGVTFAVSHWAWRRSASMAESV